MQLLLRSGVRGRCREGGRGGGGGWRAQLVLRVGVRGRSAGKEGGEAAAPTEDLQAYWDEHDTLVLPWSNTMEEVPPVLRTRWQTSAPIVLLNF